VSFLVLTAATLTSKHIIVTMALDVIHGLFVPLDADVIAMWRQELWNLSVIQTVQISNLVHA
jgi:hypothetical protein